MSGIDKFKVLYTWFVRIFTFWWPDIPVVQKARGWLYSLAMRQCGVSFRVSFNVVLNRLEQLEVGNNVYFAPGCVVAGGGKVFIGDNVLVGPNVVISAENHNFNGESFVNGYVFGEVTIEKNCWIGANCSILMGAYIPSSSILGAGSVCTKSFDKPFSLYAGVPAKFIKDIRDKK